MGLPKERPISYLPFDADSTHGSPSAELQELATAFALEALSPEEGDAYRGHLAGCGLCLELVGEFQTVADLLPSALEEEAPSPGLKQTILTQARRDLEPEAPIRPERAKPGRVWWRWPAWGAPIPVGVTAILVLAVAGLIAWNIQLQLGDGQDVQGDQREFIEAIAAGGRVTQLSGTEVAPGATGTLAEIPGEEKAFLLLGNMPPLAPNEEFHVWRIVADVPSDVGAFVLAGERGRLVTLAVGFSGANAFGVSIEERGSSPAAPNLDAIVFLVPL